MAEANTTILNDINDAPTWQKVLLMLIVLTIIFFSLKNVFFYGSAKKIANLKRTLLEQQTYLNSYQDVDRNIADLEKELKNTQQRGKTNLLKKEDFPIIISQLATNRYPHVTISSVRPGEAIVQSKYAAKDLYVTCEGSLAGIMGVITSIKGLLRSGTIDTVTIAQASEKSFSAELHVIAYLQDTKK